MRRKCYISLYSIMIPGGNQLQYVRVFQHIIQVGNLPHGCEFGGLVQNNLQT
jgi:hypothetical protein